ncbi:hypothetical protein PHMEG_00014830 [Phytophthora megakarya]|uniref:DDE-1 domain-containing protein n=1 Tax=Phytophthora megakarya TaxID=4795 RepID=A0A225W4W2_9STRA|nr:hypothetical protein PHMEG_00014830 [Phytophthora megakarya]
MFIRRFLKRNRLMVRRITHKGRGTVNGFRLSVFLAASATGKKLNAYCDAKVIHDWIESRRICQPMDVSVMKAFKNQVTNAYLQYHINHPFPSNPREKRAVMSKIVAEAWDAIPTKVIVNGFIKELLVLQFPQHTQEAVKQDQVIVVECETGSGKTADPTVPHAAQTDMWTVGLPLAMSDLQLSKRLHYSLDGAHEHTLSTDILFSLLKEVLPKRRVH